VTITELGSLGEFISSLVVLATLIYLAVQVRQSNRLSRAQARQTMMQVVQGELYKLIENPELISAMGREPNSEEERGKVAMWLTAGLRQREFDWMQYKDGVIDEETYHAYSGVIPILLGTEATRRWWAGVGSSGFSQEFIAEVSRILEDAPPNDFFRANLDWA
jgi:hypothetical protein